MSQLATARRQLNSIKSLIRQEKFLSAVQTLREAVITVFREPLMKAEKEEFDASFPMLPIISFAIRMSASPRPWISNMCPARSASFLTDSICSWKPLTVSFRMTRGKARVDGGKKTQELERGQQKLEPGRWTPPAPCFPCWSGKIRIN